MAPYSPAGVLAILMPCGGYPRPRARPVGVIGASRRGCGGASKLARRRTRADPAAAVCLAAGGAPPAARSHCPRFCSDETSALVLSRPAVAAARLLVARLFRGPETSVGPGRSRRFPRLHHDARLAAPDSLRRFARQRLGFRRLRAGPLPAQSRCRCFGEPTTGFCDAAEAEQAMGPAGARGVDGARGLCGHLPHLDSAQNQVGRLLVNRGGHCQEGSRNAPSFGSHQSAIGSSTGAGWKIGSVSRCVLLDCLTGWDFDAWREAIRERCWR